MNFQNNFTNLAFGNHIEKMDAYSLDRYRIYLEGNILDATHFKSWRVGCMLPVWNELLSRVNSKING